MSVTVTSGNWVTKSINGMQYDVLLPANYDPATKYPTVLYLHQLDQGNYPSALLAEVDPWFNTTAFRTGHPAIVVMPLLDQTADPSGETINFGGVGTADSAGEINAIAALKQVMSQYSVDTSRVYVTGNSMGGIGTEDMAIKYNAYTGTEGKIFAAALSLAGADYGQGYPQPNPSVVAALKNVPFWAIHGGQDGSVPLAWDQNLYAAEHAIGGDMIYTQNNSLGHDVWDTYYPQAGPGSPLGWLFSQSTGKVTPPPTPSPNDTVVTGTAAAITDAAGNTWTITAGGQVAINGVADTLTGGVVELAYVNGTVWQENAGKLWWGETKPNDSWAPAAGTATSPLPVTTIKPSANDTVVTGTAAAITDAAGNKWTITAGGQVAINGVTDTLTGGVVELAYVNGTVWQENTGKLWWGETKPNDSWTPAAGTATSPLPVRSSPNNTMVLAGSAGAVTDAAGNKWTITAAGLVAVNGVADPTTGHVTQLAYVNKAVWQENSSNLWWSKASPAAAWASGANPLPAPIAITAASETVSQSQVSLVATAGAHMLFLSGSGDVVSLSGGADTVTDTGGGNTYILPAAGHGSVTFTSNILATGDTLDLKPALAGTTWNGAAATLSNYLSVTDTAKGAVLSISGGVIATIDGATTANLTTLLAHAFT